MSKITPRLYVGNYENAQNLDFLRSKNIDTIVNQSMSNQDSMAY